MLGSSFIVSQEICLPLTIFIYMKKLLDTFHNFDSPAHIYRSQRMVRTCLIYQIIFMFLVLLVLVFQIIILVIAEIKAIDNDLNDIFRKISNSL